MSKPSNIHQIACLGCSIWKSYFIDRYISGIDDQQISHELVLSYAIKSINIDSSLREILLWDSTQSINTLRQVFPSSYKKNCYVIFYDLEQINLSWNIHLQLIQQFCGSNKRVSVLLIGCKQAAKNSAIELKERKIRNAVYAQTKAKYRGKLNISDLSLAELNMKTQFAQAVQIFEKFANECFSTLKQILQALRSLRSQKFDSEWYQDRTAFDRVYSECVNRFKKRKNQQEVMIIDLLLKLYEEEKQKNREQQKMINQMRADFQHLNKKIDSLQSEVQDYCKKTSELEEQILAYEYWIVEAERLHRSLDQHIEQSVYRQKFSQFKDFAQQIDRAFEDKLRSLDEADFHQHFNSQILGEGEEAAQGQVKKNKVRLFYVEQLQKLEQIVEALSPKLKDFSH